MGRCSQVMRPRRNARYAAALFGRAVISATGTFWLLGGGGGEGGGKVRHHDAVSIPSLARHDGGNDGRLSKTGCSLRRSKFDDRSEGGGGGRCQKHSPPGCDVRCSMFEVRRPTIRCKLLRSMETVIRSRDRSGSSRCSTPSKGGRRELPHGRRLEFQSRLGHHRRAGRWRGTCAVRPRVSFRMQTSPSRPRAIRSRRAGPSHHLCNNVVYVRCTS